MYHLGTNNATYIMLFNNHHHEFNFTKVESLIYSINEGFIYVDSFPNFFMSLIVPWLSKSRKIMISELQVSRTPKNI